MSQIVGIDLGTTNSLIAVWREDKAELIPNALGDFLTPSCVSIDADGAVLVGRPALERSSTHPDRTAASFKRYMGTDRKLHLADRFFRPEELSSLVLKSLKADAEAWLREPVTDAVIAVPAYFNDAQRRATRVAGELAGLKVLRLINEPTAAALAYSVHQREGERKFLIFDLGGGTFDVSVLDFFEGVMEVRASTGDNFLGGDDFTQALCELFCRKRGIVFAALSAGDSQRLWRQVEIAKRRLTQSDAGCVSVEMRIGDIEHAVELGSDEIQQHLEPLLNKLRKPVERALRDARIPLDTLDDVILVGGATRMPLVRKLVSRMFGRLPAGNLNPDEVVALGAAVQAGLVGRHSALDEMVMTDVAPYSLGIETAIQLGANDYVGGNFVPIIERNTVVPVSREQRILTIRDRQRYLVVKVFQGEARLTRDNIALGELKLEVPIKPAAEAGADIRFTYDVSGVLEVQATTFPDGVTKTIVIEENPGAMTAEEIARCIAALASLKIHPRDQTENRTVLARADRIYEELLGEPRRLLAVEIARFQSSLERQIVDEISRTRQELTGVLDHIEAQYTY
ncbi:molecular chaperone HscC [Paraburkholderia sp. Tr-20389]|uniref:molecular chaperone HscC n=1 Tax=Paraburkholderia sp. Tr-20389 TaxID=2703903 RepID=UPI0019810027|nr:molecular chaperone HscC [Paraburkholderia sp. Tr-20389]MBN3756479.1 molecular chaperone HscC [Paraburkholderia sp. Tr-20389]